MKYVNWFSIQITHTFYSGDSIPLSAVRLIPDGATNRLIKELRLLLRANGALLEVLRPVADDGTTVLFPPQTGTELAFTLVLNDPRLAVVTDLTPLDLQQITQGSAFLQFDNLALNRFTDTTDPITIPTSTYGLV